MAKKTEIGKTCEDELRVKEILKERGIKMKELAEKMEIAPESLTRALQNNPRFSTLQSIANALGLPVHDLFKVENEENKNMRGCVFYNNLMFTFNSREELENFLELNK